MEISMEFLSNPISITALSLVLVFIYVYNPLVKKKKYHPIAGTVFNQLINFHRMHDYMADLAKKHNTYRLLSLFRSEVYTSDPANVEYILRQNFDNYGKGTYTHDLLHDLLGDGIFAVDGDKWREQRKISSHEFSTKVLRDFSSVIFRKNTIKLGNMLTEAATNDQVIDINDLFMKSTLDSIFKVAFGIDLDSMYGTNAEGVRFSNCFDDASAMTVRRFVDITWRIKKFFNVGFEKDLRRSVKVINEFVYKLIQNKIDRMKNSPDDESLLKKEDILSRFLQVNDKDPKYLRDIILNFIIAGKDTTATTMSWFLYMLCKYPEIQHKIAKEIRETTNVETFTTVEDFAACVTDEALEKMQYLHAVLTETLRLYPAVPVDPKVCFADDVLPDGYAVTKGDMVSYQPYAMGRLKVLWGEDAEEFKPERWIDENGCFKPESPFKLTAFQAGPRICLGREFAYRQMKIFSSVLVGYFEFKLADEKRPVKYRTMINLHIDGGLHVRLSKRLN